MTECLLCSRKFGMITPAHLKSIHNITPDDYRRMFPSAVFWSAEGRQTISDSLVKHFETNPVSEETRQMISKAATGNRSMTGQTRREDSKRETSTTLTATYAALSPEVKAERGRRISVSLTGHVLSDETKRMISSAQLGNTHALGCTHDKESNRVMRRELSEAMTPERKQEMSELNKELWKDPEFVARWSEGMTKASFRRKPNESELRLQSILDRHFPGEWKYVGDGQFWIEGRNPDFVNINGRKQIIEMFGVFWHDPDLFPNRPSGEELIAHYKQFGFDCLVMWEHDVWNEEEVVKQVGML